MGKIGNKPAFFTALIFTSVLSVSVFYIFFGWASKASADFDCLTLDRNASFADRQYCQNQITQLEQQLQVLNNQLNAQKAQTGTLQGDIDLLNTKITAKKTEIKSKLLKISQLKDSINEKQTTIESLGQKITREKDSLAQLLRKTDAMDRTTFESFIFSLQSMSGFYSDISRFSALSEQVKASVDNIKTIKGVTEQKKVELQKEQSQTVDEKATLESVQKSIEQDKANQKTLLSISKDKEVQYKSVIAQQQAKVAQIKARLFQVAGGGQAIRFDVALQYATAASSKTGVDPAFLLAILTQESNLGSNVGTCYLTDTNTGAGVSVKSGKMFPNVMKPGRDIPPFLDIVRSLGSDPTKTVVSCPIAGAGGWGGAMGPAQFIASTWATIVKEGKNMGLAISNPWSPADAFTASSLFLSDLGASGGSYSSQIRAACKYYGTGGSTCSYGRSVMKLMSSIQGDIDYLNQYGVSRR